MIRADTGWGEAESRQKSMCFSFSVIFAFFSDTDRKFVCCIRIETFKTMCCTFLCSQSSLVSGSGLFPGSGGHSVREVSEPDRWAAALWFCSEDGVFLAASVSHSINNNLQSLSNHHQTSLCCWISFRVVLQDSFGVFGDLAAAVGIVHQFKLEIKGIRCSRHKYLPLWRYHAPTFEHSVYLMFIVCKQVYKSNNLTVWLLEYIFFFPSN